MTRRHKRKKPDSSMDSSNMEFGDDISANSTKSEKNATTELIQKYRNLDNPTNNDLKELLIASLQAQTRASDQISSIKLNLRETRGIVDDHTSRISNLEKNLSIQQDLNQKLLFENTQLRSELNIVNQKDVDCDVLVSGFIDSPDTNKVMEILHQKVQFSDKNIKNVNSWSVAQNGTKRGFMLLSFLNKSAQIDFMVKKIAAGPILLNEIMSPQGHANYGNNQLYFNNRLSQVNQEIQKKIRQLKKEKKITESKYKNCQFHIKPNPGDDFLPVPTLGFLHEIFDLNKTSY
jgi:hypothetical protein